MCYNKLSGREAGGFSFKGGGDEFLGGIGMAIHRFVFGEHFTSPRKDASDIALRIRPCLQRLERREKQTDVNPLTFTGEGGLDRGISRQGY